MTKTSSRARKSPTAHVESFGAVYDGMIHCRRGDVHPKTNATYWRAKIQRNVERDARNRKTLREAGWAVLTVWECEAKARDRNALSETLRKFLGEPLLTYFLSDDDR